MMRLVLFLLAILALASGLAWLADRPGSVVVNWEGYDIQTNVFVVVVAAVALLGLALFLWSLGRIILTSPSQLGSYLTRRRQRTGLDALSSGMIAIGAGDRSSAARYALQARKSLPNEPLTHLLRAQAAQLSGDRATARRIFEAMLASPDTEQLGLRGLYLEAMREGEPEAARQFAERAARLNSRLGWPLDALYDVQIKAHDWAHALETVDQAKRIGHLDKATADRRRAVLLTAEAQAIEDTNAEKALAYASEAHGLAPDLIPAAAIAGRILAARGNTAKAAKIIQRTWSKAPHPDLAAAYAFARIGDSPRDRLDRLKQLAALRPNDAESSLAVAEAALDAKLFDEARHALSPLLGERLTKRTCRLMARIEKEDKGDAGRAREWVARSTSAARDPQWMADGVVAEQWAPVSPKTGAFDVFEWKVPDVPPAVATDAVDLLTGREPGAPAAIKAPAVAKSRASGAEDLVDTDPDGPVIDASLSGEGPFPRPPDDPGPTDSEAEIDKGTPVIRTGRPPVPIAGTG